jgi:hypothetical protein
MKKFLTAFCLASLAPLSSFGPLIVPVGTVGEVSFLGFVDTTGPGLQSLLGSSFNLTIDYLLTFWDGVSALTFNDGFGNTCSSLQVQTNCVRFLSGTFAGTSIAGLDVVAFTLETICCSQSVLRVDCWLSNGTTRITDGRVPGSAVILSVQSPCCGRRCHPSNIRA